jgi:hypothetical protein
MDNTILGTKFTKWCFAFSIFITSYYLYRFVKLIFNFIFVMFKHFKSFIFALKQIDITIPCVIIYKSNIIYFFISSLHKL